MSYYTSSTLLDYGNTTGYGLGGGGSTTSASRYDSLFGSSLTGGSTSAYRLALFHCFFVFVFLFVCLHNPILTQNILVKICIDEFDFTKEFDEVIRLEEELLPTDFSFIFCLFVCLLLTPDSDYSIQNLL